jgi:hypothetical protein
MFFFSIHSDIEALAVFRLRLPTARYTLGTDQLLLQFLLFREFLDTSVMDTSVLDTSVMDTSVVTQSAF